MSKIKVTFVETNCKKNGPIKQTLNIIRNMDKEVFEPSLVTVWPEDADNSMIDEYKKLGIPVLSANMSKKKSVLFGKKEVGQLLEQLYSEAVNTFRVITYLWDGEVFHVPLALRIGQGGSYLDNAHAGGMFIGVNDLGELNDEAFTEFGKRYKEHPDTHTVFKGYKLNFVPELIKTAKKLHLNAPQLGIISWDLTVDQNGVFVLIEANTRGQSIWFPQMANGMGAFGKNTAEILKFIAQK